MIYEDVFRPFVKPLVTKWAEIAFQERENPNTYISKELGFKISWPNGWVGDREIGKKIREQLGFPITVSNPIYILSEKMIHGIRPNINVVVESVGEENIKYYTEQSLNVLKSLNIEVLNYHIDDHFNSATLELRQINPQIGSMFQIQKIIIHNGKAYTITATELNPEHMEKEPNLVNNIKQTVQSFSFVEE